MTLTADDLDAIARVIDARLNDRREPGLPPVLPFASSVVQIATAGIAAGAFVPGAIDAAAIANGAIDAAALAAGTITAAKFGANAIDAAAVDPGALADCLVANVQYGTISIADMVGSGTATITAVDTAKSLLVLLGVSYQTAAGSVLDDAPRITLTNSTTITGTRSGTDGAIVISFCVLTFK